MRRSIPFRAAALAAVLLPFGLGACENLMGASEEDVDGVYYLYFVNGDQLPTVVAQAGADNYVELKSGSAVLEDGRYEQLMSSDIVIEGRVDTHVEKSTGSYTVDGSTLTIHADNGRTATASLDGDRMIWDDAGNSMVWVKNKPLVID